MECTRHERIVIRSIAEYHKLGATARVAVCCHFCGLDNGLSHESYSIHVDACLGRTNIYAAADTLCACKCLRDGFDEETVAFCHTLGYDSRVTSKEVYSNLFCDCIESLGNLYIVARCLAACCSYKRYWSYRDSFVYDRNAELCGDVFCCLLEIACNLENLFSDLLASGFYVAGSAVKKAYTYGDCAHVKVFVLNHVVGLEDLVNIDHDSGRIRFCASCQKFPLSGI